MVSLEAAQEGLLSAQHVNTINHLLVTDPGQARAWFQEHQGQIEASLLPRIEKTLAAVALRGQAQQAEDAIFGAGLDETSAMARARSIEDPALRDQVVSRLRIRYAERNRAVKQTERRQTQEAWNVFLKAPTLDNPAIGIVSPGEQARMIRFAEMKARKQKTESDNKTLYSLTLMAAERPEEFISENLLEHEPFLSPADFRRLADKQAALRKPAGQDREAKRILTLQQEAGRLLDQQGIEDKETRAKFLDQLDQEVVKHSIMTGKDPGRDEITGIMHRLLLPGRIDRPYLPDRKAHRFEATGEEKAKFYPVVEGVPEEASREIVKALEAKGLEVTERNILTMYQKARELGKVD
ncbi:MAG: hypothetical protein HQL59_09310 [Magnetococcales bacterium]|nr:hypothetical protein [Magnetococcales bacterium]